MKPSVSAARRAIQALGARGKTTRIPHEVRSVVLRYARDARVAGASWSTIADGVGLSISVLQRWSHADEKTARLKPVMIADATPIQSATLVFATAHGERLEGVSVQDAIRILRGLR